MLRRPLFEIEGAPHIPECLWDLHPPDVDQAEEAVLAVAAGEVDEAWLAEWLRERVRFASR